MVKTIFFSLIALILCSCHIDKRDDMATDFKILNKSVSDELDTVVSELENFYVRFKYFLEYIHDFDPQNCNILVRISIENGDTLVDFFVYDTLYKNEPEVFSIVGSLGSAYPVKIFFSDEGNLTRGVLYETQQVTRNVPIDISHSLYKPMVLCNGELIMNSPPLDDESEQ